MRLQKSSLALICLVAMCLTPSVSGAATEVATVISAPGNCAQVDGNVTFSVAGQSAKVSWISYYVDGNYLASTPPFSILWDSTSVPDGPHLLAVRAFDRSHHLLANPIVAVTVNNSASPGLA